MPRSPQNTRPSSTQPYLLTWARALGQITDTRKVRADQMPSWLIFELSARIAKNGAIFTNSELY
jgi:hypothetical protein